MTMTRPLPSRSGTPLLELRDLVVRPVPPEDGHQDHSLTNILDGVSLSVYPGEIHALMGPNGSGKSTMATTIMGSPEYEIVSGQILLHGADITDAAVDERAKGGIFLAFQYPQEVPGVPVRQFLRQALSARKGFEMSVLEVRLAIMEWMDKLGMDPSFADRYLNDGFSGGEKKRNEVLQMAILEPDIAILDETDSGLDIDALRTVGEGLSQIRATRPEMSALVITHYQRMLDYVEPDFVHVLVDGKIVESGGPEIALRLEAQGFDSLKTAGANGNLR